MEDPAARLPAHRALPSRCFNALLSQQPASLLRRVPHGVQVFRAARGVGAPRECARIKASCVHLAAVRRCEPLPEHRGC